MTTLLNTCLKTLHNTRILLQNLPSDIYSNKSVVPYNSSIGSHIRHILDFYNCIIEEDESGVDLTKRKRCTEIETCCQSALEYLKTLEESLKISNPDSDRILKVKDDLGSGLITLNYTFGALMAQANSHTIHHYAIINYILNRLNVKVEDGRFGFNPSTPKTTSAN